MKGSYEYQYDFEWLLDPRNVSVQQNVQEFIEVVKQSPDPILYMKLIQEEFDEFWDSDPDDSEHELKEMCDLVYVIYGYAISKGYNMDEAFRRVHENNIGRCVQEDGSVKYQRDGKVMKNEDYPPVDLGDCV